MAFGIFTQAKGQGAMEYLLLIGGAILVAVIILSLLVTGIVPYGNLTVQDNVQTSQVKVCQGLLPFGLFTPADCTNIDGGPPGDFRNFNLSYSSSTPQTITLSWIWPGDDGIITGGLIAGYELKYSTTGTAITNTNFSSQLDVNPANIAGAPPLPLPGPAGSTGVYTITLPSPLPAQGYYFGIRAYDDVSPNPNVSPSVVTNHYP